MITNPETRTTIDEIADGIHRIHTPVELPGGQRFSFNQYLLVDDEPLLFHTGPRRMFALVREAMAAVMPVERLRHVAFSHTEADECGSLNDWLAVAPQAAPLCSTIAAMVSIGDIADRPPRALADGEQLVLGRHTVQWFDTPHVPHGWDCGYLGELSTRTLLCGDLFTQPGADTAPLTQGDILGPSEAMRSALDYFSHHPETSRIIERFAGFEPRVLACMHGSSFAGDGRRALLELSAALSRGASRS